MQAFWNKCAVSTLLHTNGASEDTVQQFMGTCLLGGCLSAEHYIDYTSVINENNLCGKVLIIEKAFNDDSSYP